MKKDKITVCTVRHPWQKKTPPLGSSSQFKGLIQGLASRRMLRDVRTSLGSKSTHLSPILRLRNSDDKLPLHAPSLLLFIRSNRSLVLYVIHFINQSLHLIIYYSPFYLLYSTWMSRSGHSTLMSEYETGYAGAMAALTGLNKRAMEGESWWDSHELS